MNAAVSALRALVEALAAVYPLQLRSTGRNKRCVRTPAGMILYRPNSLAGGEEIVS